MKFALARDNATNLPISVRADIKESAQQILNALRPIVRDIGLGDMSTFGRNERQPEQLQSTQNAEALVGFLANLQYVNVSNAITKALNLPTEGPSDALTNNTVFGQAWMVLVDFSRMIVRHERLSHLTDKIEIDGGFTNRTTAILHAFELCLSDKANSDTLMWLQLAVYPSLEDDVKLIRTFQQFSDARALLDNSMPAFKRSVLVRECCADRIDPNLA